MHLFSQQSAIDSLRLKEYLVPKKHESNPSPFTAQEKVRLEQLIDQININK